MLSVEGVTRTFGSGRTAAHALRGVSFTVQAGQLVALRGRSGSDMAVTSRSPTRTRPPSGWSSPPTMLSSVVLPDPDRPRRATSSPRVTVNDTPRSARTTLGPLP